MSQSIPPLNRNNFIVCMLSSLDRKFPLQQLQVPFIDWILQLMTPKQWDRHSKRRPERVWHLIIIMGNVDTSTKLRRCLMIECDQQMLGGLFVRFQVDADHTNVIAGSNEARLNFQRLLICCNSLNSDDVERDWDVDWNIIRSASDSPQ